MWIALALFYAAALAWFAWLVRWAPEGWEDERGWHAGRPEGED